MVTIPTTYFSFKRVANHIKLQARRLSMFFCAFNFGTNINFSTKIRLVSNNFGRNEAKGKYSCTRLNIGYLPRGQECK